MPLASIFLTSQTVHPFFLQTTKVTLRCYISCDFRHLHDKTLLCFLITTIYNYTNETVFQSTADHPQTGNTDTFVLL